MFSNRNVGKTLVTRTTGIKIASEGLKGRVIEACLADLNAVRTARWAGGGQRLAAAPAAGRNPRACAAERER